MDKAEDKDLSEEEKDLENKLKAFKDKFIEVMDDDLNTADAITVLFDIAKFVNTKLDSSSSKDLVDKTYKLYSELFQSLGLLAKKKEADVDVSKIEELIAKRSEAKKAKDFATADKIRDELSAMGITIKDTREGVKWEIS